MKLENKLIAKRFTAFALAGMMVVGVGSTLVGNKLDAASSNRVTLVQTVKKDTELEGGNEPHLILKLEDTLTKNNTFYLELENAQWLVDGALPEDKIKVESSIPGTKFEIDRQSDRLLGITLLSNEFDSDGQGTMETVDRIPAGETIKINLRTKVLRGEASVHVDSNSTVISSSRETFAIVDGKGVSIAVNKEIPTFYEDGTIAELRLEERYAGAFTSETVKRDDAEYAYINFRMYDNDFEFANIRSLEIEGIKGFAGIDTSKIEIESPDRDEIRFYFPANMFDGYEEKGGFDIKNLDAVAAVKEPDNGNLVITISSELFDTTDVTVAHIKNYTLETTIRPVSKENAKGLVAGRKGDYKVDLKETITDTLADGRSLTFEVDKGFMIDVETRNRTDAMNRFSKFVKLPRTMKLEDVILEDTKVIGFSVDVTAKKDDIDEYSLTLPVTASYDLVDIFDIEKLPRVKDDKEVYEDDEDDDGGSSVNFGGGKEKDDYEDDLEVMPISYRDEEKEKEEKNRDLISLIVSGRALANDKVKKEVTRAIKPMTISSKELGLKTGLKDQDASDIIIKETDVGMIRKGFIEIMFDNVEGLSFSKAPKVEVTSGDLRLGKGELIRSGRSIVGVRFEVTRPSRRTASVITIEDIIVTADRTVPEGATGILLNGDALMDQGDPLESRYYVNIGALNLDDQKELDKKEKEEKVKEISSKFTIGSTSYVANGETKQMDAAPYIESDRTMMPVRYVSDALGIEGRRILFNQGVVTILIPDKIIQFKIGSNVMLINGSQIPMDAPLAIKEGRTFVPVAYLASALETYVYFDEETKTVHFNNLVDPDPAKKGIKDKPTDKEETMSDADREFEELLKQMENLEKEKLEKENK